MDQILSILGEYMSSFLEHLTWIRDLFINLL